MRLRQSWRRPVNPRQRRGAFLVTIAALGAIGVFVAVSGYVSDVRSQVGPMTTVLRLRTDAPAFRPITVEMVEETRLPDRWAPRTATQSRRQVVGLVPGTDLPRGSILQAGMLVPAPGLAPGEREIAILVDAETGVAGKVTPGSVVDIYATFEGENEGQSRSEIIVSRARIIGVGSPETVSDEDSGGTFAEGKVVPVTFALSVQESLVLTFAESFATKVRLALIGDGDDTSVALDGRRFELGQPVGTPASPPAPPSPVPVAPVPAAPPPP